MGSLAPLILKHWKGLTLISATAAVGVYIAFLHHTINNDHIMLDAAHDQMTKMAAEYRADVDAMSAAIKTQNDAIDKLETAGAIAADKLKVANEKATKVRSGTNNQVNNILAQPQAVGCNNSIVEAISNVKDLSWESIK